MAPALPRGIRNNNPGNIRRSGDPWLGLAPEQSDPDFFRFQEPFYGLRALAVVLRNYYDRHGLDTVSRIVARWAPESENDTAAYAHDVAAAMGADPNETLDLRDPETLAALVKAIVRHENGEQPYGDALIDRAAGNALGA